MKAVGLLWSGALVALVACHRDPLPSERAEACTSICASLGCANPDLEPDVIERCESSCAGKFEASVDQGSTCEDAYEQATLCLAELSCSEYGSWYTLGPDAACPSARADVESACAGIYLEPEVLPP